MPDTPLLNVVLSDTHSGSDCALMPSECYADDGRKLGGFGKNPRLSWLYDRWRESEDWIARVTNGQPFVLTMVGDLIEGIHHRSDEIISAKWEEHSVIHRTVFNDLYKLAARVIIVKGTECHTGNWEEAIRQQLGLPEPAKDLWQYELHGCLIDAKHHMPTSGRKYLHASAHSIFQGNATFEAASAGHRIPDVFLRGHRHVFGSWTDGRQMTLCQGAWQLLTRYGKKVVPDAVPGPSVSILDWREKEVGELPDLRFKRFAVPQEVWYE